MLYNLIRTNPSLTGNVKLGCYITNGKIDMVKFNPLSHQSPMMMDPVDMKSSTYGEGLKNYYKYYSDIFYNFPIDPQFEDNQHYLWNPDGVIDNKLSDCEVGMKRVSYEKNKKQFSFLLPIYIEGVDDLKNENGSWKQINVKIFKKKYDNNGKLKSSVIANKTISLKDTEFGDFFLNHISNKDMDENVINLKVNDFNSTIHGLSANTGQFAYTTDDIGMNLGTSEKLLLEFDSLICGCFEKYTLVSKQMFNLCFYFNLEDLGMTKYNMSELTPDDMIDVNFEFENTLWYDLDFNYTNIDKIEYSKVDGRIVKNISEKRYVNDYLNDDKVINTIYKNKLLPTINKWSSTINNDYVINLYNGYAPILKDGEKSIETNSIYNDTPDIFYKDSAWTKFNKNWGNLYKAISQDGKMSYDEYKGIIQEYSQPIKNDQCIYNGLKYDFQTNEDYKGYKSLSIIQMCKDFDSELPSGDVVKKYESVDEKLILLVVDKIHLILIYKSNEIINTKYDIYDDASDIPTIYQLLNNKDNDDELIYPFFKQYLVPYDIYKFNTQLGYSNDTPSFVNNKGVEEVNIYKYDDQPIVLYRYFGWIKPKIDKLTSVYNHTIIQKGLYIKSHTMWTKIEKMYAYTDEKFGYNKDIYIPMNYPSINLYTLEDMTKYAKSMNGYIAGGSGSETRETSNNIYISNDVNTPTYDIIVKEEGIKPINLTERKFFLNSYFFNLPKEIILSKLLRNVEIIESIQKYLNNLLKLNDDSNKINYVKNLYNIELDFDKDSNNYNTEDDTFKIKLNLK